MTPTPLKWHGGKAPLAGKIAALMPPHTHYVEPFAGGLSVLLAHGGDGRSEVANDIDGGLSNFWRVLQDAPHFAEFHREVEAVPFSEAEWEGAGKHPQCPKMFPESTVRCVPCAVRFFVRCRQSMAGRMKTFSPLVKTRLRRGMNDNVSAWLSAVEGLPAVHARLRRVAVLNRPALKVIDGQDGPATLFYCDPPYTPDSRAAPDVYAHEMTPIDHVELLSALQACRGKVMLSGYPNPLYDSTLRGWHVVDFDCANHAAGGASKRRMVERLWCNFPPQEAP